VEALEADTVDTATDDQVVPAPDPTAVNSYSDAVDAGSVEVEQRPDQEQATAARPR
jgi:hypothetical protein